MCDGKNHNLKVIARFGNDMEEEVVRWCRDCGGVVVDLDFDGRTRPGYIRKMQVPRGNKNEQRNN